MKIKLLIISVLLSVADAAMAYTISGTVTSGGEPMPGALITRIGGNGGEDVEHAVADIDGHYTIESGSSENVLIIAQYVSHISEMKYVNSPVVNFDLKETPRVPVKFFSTILDQSALLEYMLTEYVHQFDKHLDFHVFLSDDTLVFALPTDKQSISDYGNINKFGVTTIKGYLDELRADGELDNFLSQMQRSGMKWGFGVYNKTSRKWLQYKEYDAAQIKKLL